MVGESTMTFSHLVSDGEGSVKTEVVEVCLRCSRTLPTEALCWSGREHEPATLTSYWGVAEIDISFPGGTIAEAAREFCQ